jgi:DNA-binding MarR family transcriptional regulator
METFDIIIKTLNESSEPLKGGQIAEKSGIDKKEVDKAIKKMIKGEIIYSPNLKNS